MQKGTGLSSTLVYLSSCVLVNNKKTFDLPSVLLEDKAHMYSSVQPQAARGDDEKLQRAKAAVDDARKTYKVVSGMSDVGPEAIQQAAQAFVAAKADYDKIMASRATGSSAAAAAAAAAAPVPSSFRIYTPGTSYIPTSATSATQVPKVGRLPSGMLATPSTLPQRIHMVPSEYSPPSTEMRLRVRIASACRYYLFFSLFFFFCCTVGLVPWYSLITLVSSNYSLFSFFLLLRFSCSVFLSRFCS